MHARKGVSRRYTIGMIIGVPVFCVLFMFWPAGSFAWFKGWLFIGVMSSLEFALVAYVWRRNPELIIARSRFHAGTKTWDKIVLACLVPAMLAIFPLAALDDSRFAWSNMPGWGVAAGYLFLFIGLAISTAAMVVNKFAEPTVRIQTERGHRVVDSGPYAVIRHPLYLAAFLLFPGIALALGSWWALGPALFAIVILLVRTELEDRTLQRELAGYQAYTGRVRYRLIPGIW